MYGLHWFWSVSAPLLPKYIILYHLGGKNRGFGTLPGNNFDIFLRGWYKYILIICRNPFIYGLRWFWSLGEFLKRCYCNVKYLHLLGHIGRGPICPNFFTGGKTKCIVSLFQLNYHLFKKKSKSKGYILLDL